MSAYICNPEHFGILAAYAVQHDAVTIEWGRGKNRIETVQTVAKGLARENIRSVAHRYPDDVSGSRPGPCLSDDDIQEAAAIYAAHFLKHPQKVPPVQLFKLIQCLDYQSCETGDWRETLAFEQLEYIQREVVRQLPGYNDADWSFEKELPEIEALYQEV